MAELIVKVEEVSSVVRKLQIQVPAERVSTIVEQVYQRVGRNAKLKGYRPGHIPRHILERHYSDQVRNDALREVVEATYGEALTQSQTRPVAEPTVEPSVLEKGKDFSYTARVEVRPPVDLKSYKALSVEYTEEAVSDAKVDEKIAELQESMSSLEPLEGRDVAQMGDIGSIEYTIEFIGLNRAPQKRDNALVRIEPGLFIDGKGEALVGLKVGDSKEFTEKFPEKDVTDDLKGRDAKILVKLSGLKTRQLPELNDEFAKEARGLDTFAALKEAVRKELEETASANNAGAKKTALIDQLIAQNPVEAPPSLVDNNATRLARNFLESMQMRGLPMGNSANTLLDNFKKEFTPKALADVKAFILLEAVAEKEEIKIGSEEIMEQLGNAAKEEGISLKKLLERMGPAQAIGAVASQMRNDRAFELVEKGATFTAKSA